MDGWKGAGSAVLNDFGIMNKELAKHRREKEAIDLNIVRGITQERTKVKKSDWNWKKVVVLGFDNK